MAGGGNGTCPVQTHGNIDHHPLLLVELKKGLVLAGTRKDDPRSIWQASEMLVCWSPKGKISISLALGSPFNKLV